MTCPHVCCNLGYDWWGTTFQLCTSQESFCAFLTLYPDYHCHSQVISMIYRNQWRHLLLTWCQCSQLLQIIWYQSELLRIKMRYYLRSHIFAKWVGQTKNPTAPQRHTGLSEMNYLFMMTCYFVDRKLWSRLIFRKILCKDYMTVIKELPNVVFGHVALFGGQVYQVISIILYISVISAVKISSLQQSQWFPLIYLSDHRGKVASDLFELKGTPHIVVVDYFSRYIEVMKLTTTTSAAIISALKAIFRGMAFLTRWQLIMVLNMPQQSLVSFQNPITSLTRQAVRITHRQTGKRSIQLEQLLLKSAQKLQRSTLGSVIIQDYTIAIL